MYVKNKKVTFFAIRSRLLGYSLLETALKDTKARSSPHQDMSE